MSSHRLIKKTSFSLPPGSGIQEPTVQGATGEAVRSGEDDPGQELRERFDLNGGAAEEAGGQGGRAAACRSQGA